MEDNQHGLVHNINVASNTCFIWAVFFGIILVGILCLSVDFTRVILH